MVFGLLIVAGSILGIGLAAWAVNRLTLKDGDPSEASWTPPRRDLDLEAYNLWLRKEVWGEKCNKCPYCWRDWSEEWWESTTNPAYPGAPGFDDPDPYEDY